MANTTLSGAKLKKVLRRWKATGKPEIEAYHTYQTLADRDTLSGAAQVLRHLPAPSGST